MEKLIQKFLNSYNDFLQVDINISLLYGREYELLYEILISLNYDVFLYEKNFSDSNKSIEFLQENIEIYKSKMVEIFTTIERENFENHKLDLKKKSLSLFLETINDVWDEFMEAYNKLSIYKDANIHEILLIEFNNSLSHIIYYYKKDDKSNLKKAKEHLYRATLDAYKEIINEESNIIIVNKDLMKKYLDIRLSEQQNIGLKEKEIRDEIITNYKDIAKNILTLLNF